MTDSLCLPGIGSFTIIDGNQVSGEDAGNKYALFFSNICMLGKAVYCHRRVKPKSQLHLNQGDLTQWTIIPVLDYDEDEGN